MGAVTTGTGAPVGSDRAVTMPGPGHGTGGAARRGARCSQLIGRRRSPVVGHHVDGRTSGAAPRGQSAGGPVGPGPGGGGAANSSTQARSRPGMHGQQGTVPDGTVAHHRSPARPPRARSSQPVDQRLGRDRLQSVVRGPTPGRPVRSPATRPIEPVGRSEHLAPPGIDHRHHPLGARSGPRQRRRPPRPGRRGCSPPTTPMPSAWASALAVATPTRRPVNRPGPTSTRDRVDVGHRAPGHGAHLLDGRDQELGVGPSSRRGPARPTPPSSRSRRDPDRVGGRLDGQQAHRSARHGASASTSRGPPIRPGVPARGECDRLRSVSSVSSVSLGVLGVRAQPHGERPSPRTGSAASPHSTRATPPSSTSSPEAQVDDLVEVVETVDVGVQQRPGHPTACPPLDRVLADQREGGAGDRARRSPGPPRTPGRRWSCRRPGHRPAGQHVAGHGTAGPGPRPAPGSGPPRR